jgi:hypothetical protein
MNGYLRIRQHTDGRVAIHSRPGADWLIILDGDTAYWADEEYVAEDGWAELAVAQPRPIEGPLEEPCYVVINRLRLLAGMLVGIGGEHDPVPNQHQLDRAAELIFRNNPVIDLRAVTR